MGNGARINLKGKAMPKLIEKSINEFRITRQGEKGPERVAIEGMTEGQTLKFTFEDYEGKTEDLVELGKMVRSTIGAIKQDAQFELVKYQTRSVPVGSDPDSDEPYFAVGRIA